MHFSPECEACVCVHMPLYFIVCVCVRADQHAALAGDCVYLPERDLLPVSSHGPGAQHLRIPQPHFRHRQRSPHLHCGECLHSANASAPTLVIVGRFCSDPGWVYPRVYHEDCMSRHNTVMLAALSELDIVSARV